MPLILLKMALGEFLANDATKKAIMDELRKLAAQTDNDLDDEAVTVFGKIYDTVVPVISSQIK